MFASPFTPHWVPFLQPPNTVSQLTVPPQPSEIIPHCTPEEAAAALHNVVADGGVHAGWHVLEDKLHV
jgi:hypothetical protein